MLIVPQWLPNVPGVYRLRNRTTGDTYVGSTHDLKMRARGHFTNISRGTMTHRIRDAINAGGKLHFEVLEVCTTDLLKGREQHWICELGPSLNSRKFAEDHPGRKQNKIVTDEQSAAEMGRFACATDQVAIKRRDGKIVFVTRDGAKVYNPSNPLESIAASLKAMVDRK